MRAIRSSTNAGTASLACRLQKRAGGACQPCCHGARADQRGPARNARVEHSLSPSSALCRALRAFAGSESLTQCVTGYMTERKRQLQSVKPRDICRDLLQIKERMAERDDPRCGPPRTGLGRVRVARAQPARQCQRATRAAGRRAVRELGYVPHAGARSLSLARTNAIGVVLPDFHGEFFSEIVRGMDREASRRGYMLLLSNMHAGSEQSENACVRCAAGSTG